ncbi:hypothetical protein DRQ25_10905 [Candidatus Fermentibacteria bacterium]|nr:MAG: hypothetical protein DRQ25_10905 [Candidatus Fermentibacteria bacterium]
MRSGSILFTVLLILLYAFEAYGNSATQSNWSGGPGVPGPVILWEEEFHLDNVVEWRDSAGSVTLLPPLELVIDGDYYSARSVHSKDIDGDGDMDVLGAAYSTDDISWWENVDGFGTIWIKHNITLSFDGARTVYSEDIDGDGDMDVIGAATYANSITWWENEDGSGIIWIEHIVTVDFNSALSVHVEDIDGDGDMDILGAAFLLGDIAWWENADGLGISWIKHSIHGSLDCPASVYSADINDDGYMDVLGAVAFADDIIWWENVDGFGTIWIKHYITSNFDGAHSVYSEDIDGDGDMDVIGAATYSNEIAWWENSDTGQGIYWIEHTVDGDFNGAISVHSDDIDGDGDMDILGAAYEDGKIIWWENIDGSGTSWTEFTIDEEFDAAISVYSADIDDDGNMDILGASTGNSDITWWDLTAYSPEGSLESSILDIQGIYFNWNDFDWNATIPANTSVSFQLRASWNHIYMGVWSDTLTSPCSLAGILQDGRRYVQYRVILNSSDPDTTPVLNDVTISWNPVGVGEELDIDEYFLFGAEPNPASDFVRIGFSVPDYAPVELSIYDLSGRLVIMPSHVEYAPGVHHVHFTELNPGIYFCQMRAGDFTATQRFLVIE